MAYDEDLAGRLRGLLDGEAGVTEKAMFGGLAFLVDGRMALAASGRGVVMLRLDEGTAQRLGAVADLEEVRMRGRVMRGWWDADTTRLDESLVADLVAGAVARARAVAQG